MVYAWVFVWIFFFTLQSVERFLQDLKWAWTIMDSFHALISKDGRYAATYLHYTLAKARLASTFYPHIQLPGLMEL